VRRTQSESLNRADVPRIRRKRGRETKGEERLQRADQMKVGKTRGKLNGLVRGRRKKKEGC